MKKHVQWFGSFEIGLCPQDVVPEHCLLLVETEIMRIARAQEL